MEIVERDFVFEVESNRCILQKVLRTEPTLLIPSHIQGLPVDTIGERAFYKCSGLKEVVLPPTIGFIRAFAFSESDIERVTRSIDGKSSILYVDRFAFADCWNLHFVELGGATFLELSGYQFKNCHNLKHIDSQSIKGTIPMGAFMGCGLRYYVIPDGTKISFDAFKDVELDMIFVMGRLGNTSNFFQTHKEAKIVCEDNNAVMALVYSGYDVACREGGFN